jgi:hypothetical protein
MRKEGLTHRQREALLIPTGNRRLTAEETLTNEHAHRTDSRPLRRAGAPCRMSTHLLIAAAYLEGLPQGRKLVLMAIADSADEHTLEAAPGLPKLRAWSGLGKSQALAIVAQLVDGKYLERLEAGRLGRRAVYRVFPLGVPAIPHPSEVAARYSTDAAEPVDNSAQEGPAGRTLGSDEASSRVRPTGPLHASTSVSRASAASEPVETRRPPASGFPGSRATAEEERGIARRARGANNVPCHVEAHAAAGETMPCGRCAHAAAEDRRRNPDGHRQAIAAAKAAVAAARYPAQPTTTEEPTP